MALANTESGRIVAIEDRYIWVETVQKSTCQACSQQSGCGTYTLSKWAPSSRNQIRVPLGQFCAQDLALGDYVQIKINDGVVLKSALIVYILPLATMILGASLLDSWWQSDLAAMLGALAGLVIGFLLVRLHAYINQNNPDLQPELVGIENPQNCYIPIPIRELSE